MEMQVEIHICFHIFVENPVYCEILNQIELGSDSW